MGARKGYNPHYRGKKSYQPILTFLAETREYVMGELHNGDRPPRRSDRPASGAGLGGVAARGGDGVRTGRLGLLLLGSGGEL
jgi:hypothetical protein